MSFFIGTHLHRIDKKGRLSIPAKYRAHIATSGTSDIHLFPSSEPAYPALFGCSAAVLGALSIHQQELCAIAGDAETHVSDIFSDAREFGLDEGGRIVVLPNFIEFLGPDEEGRVEIVGQGQHFEIWRPDRFLEHRSQRRESTIRKLLTAVAAKLAPRKEASE